MGIKCVFGEYVIKCYVVTSVDEVVRQSVRRSYAQDVLFALDWTGPLRIGETGDDEVP